MTNKGTGRTSYEASLASHETAESGFDIGDGVHKHFAKLSQKLEHWCDVAEEGRRLWSVMLKETIEEWSVADAIISGVAAAAYCLAISEVAKKLNVSEFALRCGLESQEEEGVAGFLAECQKYNHPEQETRT